MTDICFWQDVISLHQTPFLEALARRTRRRVRLICEQREQTARRDQGWLFKPPDGVDVLSPEDGTPAVLIADALFGRGATHVFNGFHSVRMNREVLPYALEVSEDCYVLTERPRLYGPTALLKPVLYASHSLRFGNRLKGVISYGDAGADFYRCVGFSKRTVWPFAYTVRQPDETALVKSHPEGMLRWVFVGSQLRRKGLDVLIAALVRIGASAEWALDVVTADDVTSFRDAVEGGPVAGRISFHKPMPNPQVRRLMSAADGLILPSRYDGWGAVVNEALHAGTRVIASDHAGASCLLAEAWRGRVVRARSVSALEAALRAELASPKATAQERERIIAWAAKAISPEAMADHFLAILEGTPRPPPWRTASV